MGLSAAKCIVTRRQLDPDAVGMVSGVGHGMGIVDVVP